MSETTKASYQLPDLPYDYADLEPVISAEIMQLHHQKHHQAYVNNLNAALEKYHDAEGRNDVATMIAFQAAIKFNGGGHINHSIFWTLLVSPTKRTQEKPQGDLAQAIDQEFGSFEKFQEKFNTETIAIQGSGWGWLGYSKAQKKLEISTCANQDPLSTQGLIPLVGVDVWEHAYYLQYKNVRPDYVKAMWKIFNWKHIEERFAKAVM